jgi:hypothetical protein
VARLTMTDGLVPPDEKLRLVNALGADEATRMIAEAEADAAPPPAPKRAEKPAIIIETEE